MLINKEGGGNMSDIKLNQIQSLKITKALMKEWTADQSQININYQPVMIVGQKEEESLDLNDLEVLILVILEKLPKPKIKNLSRLAYHACFSKFSGLRNFRTKAADYLGVQRSGLYHYVNEFKASGNFLEKIEKNAP